MENPATWGEPERIVHDAIAGYNKNVMEGRFGLSLARQITDALRAQGYLPPPSGTGTLTRITDDEHKVIVKLIAETEDAITDIGRVLGDDAVITALTNARDVLRGIRDAGQWCAFARPARRASGRR
jgi:hypothetical protein